MAPIASALVVELLVSLLQHPLQARAPAWVPTPPQKKRDGAPSANLESSTEGSSAPSLTDRTRVVEDPFEHPLGRLPHTIRSYLSRFENIIVKGTKTLCCSACSSGILDAYRKDGFEFVKRALNEAGYVEEVSGLKELYRQAEEHEGMEAWEVEEDEDGELIG